jgi:hypothetical protein
MIGLAAKHILQKLRKTLENEKQKADYRQQRQQQQQKREDVAV